MICNSLGLCGVWRAVTGCLASHASLGLLVASFPALTPPPPFICPVPVVRPELVCVWGLTLCRLRVVLWFTMQCVAYMFKDPECFVWWGGCGCVNQNNTAEGKHVSSGALQPPSPAQKVVHLVLVQSQCTRVGHRARHLHGGRQGPRPMGTTHGPASTATKQQAEGQSASRGVCVGGGGGRGRDNPSIQREVRRAPHVGQCTRRGAANHVCARAPHIRLVHG